MRHEKEVYCSDCDDVSRRDFLASVGKLAVAAGVGSLVGVPRRATAAPTPKSTAETAVKALYETLKPEQKKVICFPFEHQLRTRISANWKITPHDIGSEFYSKDQRDLIDKVVRGVTSPEGYEQFIKQMQADAGGFNKYSVAIFGEPGTGKFEFELTGRHLTMRADGDSVDRMAFGGPIVYGHGASDPAKNIYHYQTKKANEVFAALDAKQQKQALVARAPSESQVPIQGAEGKFPGIRVGELSKDQQKLVESVVGVILAPYRKEDIDEVMEIIKLGGGVEQLSMAFYSTGDLKDDEVWDIWRVEGPTFVWHFRGAPHVHTYVNIGVKG